MLTGNENVSVRFVQGNLLNVKSMDIGEFDYVETSGVLHHLKSPADGMSALLSVVKPGGGVGVMVYGML